MDWKNKILTSFVVASLMVISMAFNAYFFWTLAAGSLLIVGIGFAFMGALFDIAKKISAYRASMFAELSAQSEGKQSEYYARKAFNSRVLWGSLVGMALVSMFGFWSVTDHQRQQREIINGYGFQAAKGNYEEAQSKAASLARFDGTTIEQWKGELSAATDALNKFNAQNAVNDKGQQAGFTVGRALSLGYKSYVARYGDEQATLKRAVIDARSNVYDFEQYQNAVNAKKVALTDLSQAQTTGSDENESPVFQNMAVIAGGLIALITPDKAVMGIHPHVIAIFWMIVISIITEWIIYAFSASSFEFNPNTVQKQQAGFVRDNDTVQNGAVYAQNSNLPKFRTGGAVHFTGPAWLDGTKDNPEYVFCPEAVKNAGGVDIVDRLHEVLKRTTASASAGRKPDGSANLNYQRAIVAMLVTMGFASNNELRKAKKNKSFFGGQKFTCGDVRMFQFRDEALQAIEECKK